ncbi:MAG TPA: dephospho-CoA kinase, partial [Vicinamibacteria bacterium]
LRVGLTGGIACGKSQVLRRLANRGLHTLDLDVVAHEVMAPGGAAYPGVVAAFGPEVLDAAGAIDRQTLGALVFRDEASRQRLNAIVHPWVWAEEGRWAQRWSGESGSVAVTDAALLVESGLHLRFDRLVVVHCSPKVQLQRLMVRDGIGEEQALPRIRAQMPIDEKRRYGHYEVDTTGSMEATWAAADTLAVEIQELAGRRPPVVSLDRERALACLRHGPARGPRGLSPAGLLLAIARRGGIVMEELKALLSPPASSVWYRAARPAEGRPDPTALAGALVLWQLSRGVADEEALLAAMASVGRLTHDGASAIGNACVLAAAMLASAAARGEPVPFGDRFAVWHAKAERWAGGPFRDEVRPVLRAAAAHPEELGRARAHAAGAHADPDLVGALIGLRGGEVSGSAPPEVTQAVDALLSLSARPETD